MQRVVLDPHSPLPLYAQLKARLLAWIEHGLATGELTFDTQIPTETELCEEYQVSRITVKRALSELTADGVIYARQGKGRFISGSKMEYDLSLHSYTAMMKSLGISAASQVLEAEVITASPQVAQFLEVDEGIPVAKLARLRFGDGEPLSISTSFMPYHLVPNLFGQNITASLFGLLQNHYGYRLVKMREFIGPVRLTATENDIFGTSGDVLGLLTQSIAHARDVGPIEYNKSTIRGDKGRFAIEHRF